MSTTQADFKAACERRGLTPSQDLFSFWQDVRLAAPSVASSAPADAEPNLKMIEAITNDLEQSINFVQVSEEELQYASAGDAHQAQAVQELRGAVSGIRSAIAASQQAAPQSPLTDDALIAQWLEFDSWPFNCGDTVLKFARAILSAAGPNTALVEALHKKAIESVQEWVQAEHKSTKSLGRGGPSHEEELDKAERKARDAIAALASLPPTQEAIK